MNLADDWQTATEQFADAFGEAYTLARGSQTTAVTAQPWDTGYETTGPNGMLTVINARELLVPIDEYALAGEPVTPRQGDRLIDPAGRVWEILPIAGRPAYERHTENWLLRTKEIAA